MVNIQYPVSIQEVPALFQLLEPKAVCALGQPFLGQGPGGG